MCYDAGRNVAAECEETFIPDPRWCICKSHNTFIQRQDDHTPLSLIATKTNGYSLPPCRNISNVIFPSTRFVTFVAPIVTIPTNLPHVIQQLLCRRHERSGFFFYGQRPQRCCCAHVLPSLSSRTTRVLSSPRRSKSIRSTRRTTTAH